MNELEQELVPNEELRTQTLNNFPKVATRDTSKMTDEERKKVEAKERIEQDKAIRTIRHLPSLKEYLSYNFTFIGICTPFVDYRDYQDFILQENNYKNIKISFTQFLDNIKELIGVQVIFMALKGYFPFDWIASDDYYKSGYLYFIGWIWIGCIGLRCRYYAGFVYGQLAVDLCGISYNEDNNDNSNYKSYYFWGVEWDQRVMGRMRAWNRSTQQWLEYCVFSRCWFLTKMPIYFMGKKIAVLPFNKSYAALLTLV